MKTTTDDFTEFEKELNSEIAFPNTWTPDRVARFNAKLLMAIYLKLQEKESEGTGKPDSKDFYVDGKFDRGAFLKALKEWKEQ
jgi:hypothetical protein